MDDKTLREQLKKAMRSELAPLLIGLRNEVANVGKIFKNAEKARPDIQKTEVTNHPEAPETQSVHVENPTKEVEITNPQKIVEVKGIKGLFGNLYNKIQQGDVAVIQAIGRGFSDFKKSVLKVEVQNQLKLPAVLKVEEQNKQEPPTVQRVKIENSMPNEAMPVKLTTKDGKRFYDAVLAVTGGANLQGVKKKLDDVIFELQNLTVTVPAMPDRPGLRVAEFLKESGGSSDINVDGSVTPVTFSASPPTGKKWFIHSISLIIEDASINFTKFGGIPGGLTNGIEFRVKEGGLVERTLGTFKTNGELHIFTIDIRLDSAATDLLTLQANVKETSGTTFELKDSNSETFKIIVNDNLTSINRFNVLIRGFEVDE